jgi:hypothetical protein
VLLCALVPSRPKKAPCSSLSLWLRGSSANIGVAWRSAEKHRGFISLCSFVPLHLCGPKKLRVPPCRCGSVVPTQTLKRLTMKEKTRIVQLYHPHKGRRIALVQEPFLQLITDPGTVYDLANAAMAAGIDIVTLINKRISGDTLEYDPVYEGQSEWKLLPSFDHPTNPLCCLVSGTGLTHQNSALNRQMMHGSGENAPTDSMLIYKWGVEGGKPAKGTIGMQPEWFYKGTGSTLKPHASALTVPSYGDDGGEEPEIAGLYIVDPEGIPWRIGFTTANEFSDHVMEKKNYLYLAPSKLRQCAIGPELVIDPDFASFIGEVAVYRKDKLLWSAAIKTGENNMCHSLANLEYHHFKYEGHRVPGQAHVHFFGADAFSFGNGTRLFAGDVMSVQWEGMGRSLKNVLQTEADTQHLHEIRSL